MEELELVKKSERPRRRNAKHEKLLRVFSASVPKLGAILDSDCLSVIEQKECVYGLNVVRKIDVRIQTEGWTKVHLAEFLNRRSPNYNGQIKALEDLGYRALHRFLDLSYPTIKITFAEHGQKVPIVLGVLYLEFHSTENVRIRRRTQLGFASGPEKTAQNTLRR